MTVRGAAIVAPRGFKTQMAQTDILRCADEFAARRKNRRATNVILNERRSRE